jgi:hypothetical protein
MLGKFANNLEVMPLADGETWKLDHSFKYWTANYEDYIYIPAGFRTDFASIPPLARIAGCVMIPALLCHIGWLVFVTVAVVLLADSLHHTGSYTRAAVVHDYLYATHSVSRRQADWTLWQAMGVCGTPLWKRILIYFNVRAFGWLCWPIVRHQ